MKATMKTPLLLAAASLLLANAAGAQTAAPRPEASPAAAAAPAAGVPRTAGEVRRVDTAQGKLTLRHERIENLDMPAMTMVFQVADPKLLEGLQVGDKVRFAVERRNAAFTVTAIEVVR